MFDRFKKYKKFIGVILISFFCFLLIYYLRSHPNSLDPLKSAPLWSIPLLLFMYCLFLITNFMITHLTIVMCRKEYKLLGSFQLTLYSTLVNFFGPLQSGPGFRAIFLKRRLGVKIRDYTAVTLLYYLSFASISLFMLFGATRPGWFIVFIGGLFFVAQRWIKKQPGQLNLARNGVLIFLMTCLQLLIVCLIYYIELRAVGHKPSLVSLLAYTGSANLALFVSITPGAIGIRESFIYFSQSIHEISTNTVLSASLFDRAIYLVFLAGLLLISSFLHIRDKLVSDKNI